MGARTGFAEATVTARPVAPPPGALRSWVEVILLALLALIFLRAFVFRQAEIPSGSMEDTILVGDYVLVNRFIFAPASYDWERRLLPQRPVRRGDIVVFAHPPQPEIDFIKRVVGLPGETVEIRAGRVQINGIELHEPYVNALYRDASDFGPVEVKPDEFFLMGDHRNRSSDSRVWGPVPRELLRGQAFMVLFSTHAAGPPGPSAGEVTIGSPLRKIFNVLFRARWDRACRLLR